MIKIVTKFEGIRFETPGVKQILFVLAAQDKQEWAASVVNKLDNGEISINEFASFFDRKLVEMIDSSPSLFKSNANDGVNLTLLNGDAIFTIDKKALLLRKKLEDGRFISVSGYIDQDGIKIGTWYNNAYSITKSDIEYVLNIFNELRKNFNNSAEELGLKDVPKIILAKALIYETDKISKLKSLINTLEFEVKEKLETLAGELDRAAQTSPDSEVTTCDA